MTIDYRELLMKYINHVGDEEGIDFIMSRLKPEYISDEEWTELERLSTESMKYHQSKP